MTKPEFVYTTYIRTTPQKVWDAITSSEFTRQYWKIDMNSTWKVGSKWDSTFVENGKPAIAGEVLESTPPKKLVISWFKPQNPADKSRCTFEISTLEDMTVLTVTHGELSAEMAAGVSMGWPRVLSSMKSFLETGTPLNTFAGISICSDDKKAVTA